ncbi:MAG: hypothetical protein ACLQD9_05830 [Thermoplasmata archaeon]
MLIAMEYLWYIANRVHNMSQEHQGAHDGVIADGDTGQVKISLSIGVDTLVRLDGIVERAGFGGRGRALDSLLESLDEVMTYVRRFNRNFSQMTDGPEWTKEDVNAFRNAIMAAALAFTKMERFYGLGSAQGSTKQ